MKEKIWKSILHILRILLWSIAVLGIMLFVPFLAGNRAYVVLSGSMEPVIHTGGIVFVNSHDKIPEPGDIVTYQLGDVTVTHRVKAVLGDELYETGGDANELSDSEPVRQEQILGTVGFSLPYLGYVLTYIRTEQGFLAIAIMLLLYMCMEHLTEKERRADKGSPQDRV